MPEVDFGNVVILVVGDKSNWRLWRGGKNKGSYTLERTGTIYGKESTIPVLTRFNGSRVEITQKGVALFKGKTLVIKTTREGNPKIPKSQ